MLDGVLLPKMPEEILAEKDFNTVPYIVGINKQEFGWILPTMMNYPPSDMKLDPMTATSLLKKSSFLLNLPEEAIPVAVEKYLRHTDDPDRNKDQLLELIGDVIFGVPSVIVSRGHRGESLRLDKRTLILPLCSATGLYPNICKCATANIKHLDIVLFDLCQYCLWISLKCNRVKGVDPRKYELVQEAVTEEGTKADT